MDKLKKTALLFSVIFLAFELPLFTAGGSGFKLWMPAAVAGVVFTLWDLRRKGFSWLKQSKIFWLGVGLWIFSVLGLINSPLKTYSAKQLLILTALVALGIFFELNINKYRKEVYQGLAWGILLNSVYAIYQNIAFDRGWLNLEIMAARPNGFFPEPDWLGIYLALGLVPFLVCLLSVGSRYNLEPTSREGMDRPSVGSRYNLEPTSYILVLIAITALTITVARASWLALIAEMGMIALVVPILAVVVIPAKAGIQISRAKGYKHLDSPVKPGNDKRVWNNIGGISGTFILLVLVSLLFISFFHLSRFNIPDRFRSIFFKEHIITEAYNPKTGERFKINLEDIDTYRGQGYLIEEEYTGDENVASRKEKFTGAWDIIKQHPLLGSGLGRTLIATDYQHNANNLFLEWWASAGLGGLLLIVGVIAHITIKGFSLIKKDPATAQMILAGTAGFIIVNLFNASIFLAFAWFYLAWLLALMKRKT